MRKINRGFRITGLSFLLFWLPATASSLDFGNGIDLSQNWIVIEQRVDSKETSGAILISNPIGQKGLTELFAEGLFSSATDNETNFSTILVGCEDSEHMLFISPVSSEDTYDNQPDNVLSQVDDGEPVLINYTGPNIKVNFGTIDELALPDQEASRRLLSEMLSGKTLVANYRKYSEFSKHGLIKTLKVELEGFKLAFMRSCPAQFAELTGMTNATAEKLQEILLKPPKKPNADTSVSEYQYPTNRTSTSTTIGEQSSTSMSAGVDWADQNHPEIDYTNSSFQYLAEEGSIFHGWWAVKEGLASIDDSKSLDAKNVSLSGLEFYASEPYLELHCSESETVLIHNDYEFVSNHIFDRDFDYTIRLDDLPSSKIDFQYIPNFGTGLSGTSAIDLIRRLRDSKKLFIRISTKNGNISDADYQLDGIEIVVEKLSEACQWPLEAPTALQYKAAQAYLNQNDYSVGPPDGVWGKRSSSALKEFQQSIGLDATGVLDPATMELMGII